MDIRYLLDTNTVIDMLKGNPEVQRHIIESGAENCYVSDITVAELKSGYYLTGSVREKKDVDFVLQNFKTVRVSPDVLDSFARSRALLRKLGKPVPALDLMIIATAITYDMVAVSHDEHFSFHPQLRLLDWTK